MPVEAAYVFPAFCYFARAGSVLCALDGFDEAVPETTLAGFLALFGEISEVLSAESAVVMTSRVSFLEDSPQVRRLLDGTRLMSEKLIQQLHAQGVDPLRVPRFSVLKVRDEEDGRSLLGQQLASQVGRGEGGEPGGVSERAREVVRGGEDLAELLWRHIGQVAGAELVPRVVEFFGSAFLRGTTVFGLVELVNGLGIGVFDDGRAELGGFRLRDLFRAARAGGDSVAFRHMAYQELLAAEYLRTRPVSTASGMPPRYPVMVVAGVLKSPCPSSHTTAISPCRRCSPATAPIAVVQSPDSSSGPAACAIESATA